MTVTEVVVREAEVVVDLGDGPMVVVVQPITLAGEPIEGPQGEQGPAGEQGPVGPTGPQGPPGTIGADGLTWRGEWSALTAYVADDAVSHDGASYVAVAGSTGSEPDPDNLNPDWDLLARGVEGPQGPEGAAGPQGNTGPPGPNVNLHGLLDTAGLNPPVPGQAVRRKADDSGYEFFDPATQAELATEQGRITTLEGVRSGKLIATRRETVAVTMLNGVDTSLLSSAFTMPANAWATGEVAEIDLLIRILNSSGANRAYSGTVTLGGQVIGRITTSSFGTAATARPWVVRLIGHMHTNGAQAWSCSGLLASVSDGSASPHSHLSDDDTTLDLTTALALDVVAQSSGAVGTGQTALLTYALAKRVRAA